MGRKKINLKSSKPHNPRRARRREARRAFKRRFKVFFDGEPDSDMDFYENGLEWMLEPHNPAPEGEND